ncbi:MAG: vWA domain-containing protein [Pseudonocardiales bacterium]
MRIGVAVAAMLAAVLPASAMATADDPAPPAVATLDEVLSAIGVDQLVAHHVVLIDTSSSMRQDDRYGQAREALANFLRATPPTDRLSLITFDVIPTLEYAGPIGDPPDRAVGLLPPEANGQYTDIGSAVSAAHGEFETESDTKVRTLIVITDGKHDPGAGSAFPSTSGPSWSGLAARVEELARTHSITSYSLSLGSGTDAHLVGTVFPNTRVVDLPVDQLQERLRGIKDEARLSKAREILEPDLVQTVRVDWSGLDALDLNADHANIRLTLTSGFNHIPVTVSGLNATVERFGAATVRGLPETAVLAPGQPRTFEIGLEFPAVGGFGVGQDEIIRAGAIQLSCRVDSPWSSVLSNELDLPFGPACQPPTADIVGRGTEGWTILALALIGGGSTLVISLVGTRQWVRQPKLHGVLEVRLDDRKEPVQARLAGRRMRIGRRRKALGQLPESGTVRGRRIPRRDGKSGTEVVLRVRYGGRRFDVAKQERPEAVGGVTFQFK